MKHRRALIILNGALLLLLAAVTLAPASVAQRAARARGEYTMVAGKIVGGNAHAAYILDAANQEMIVVRWNEGTKSIDNIGYRDLAADAAAQPGR